MSYFDQQGRERPNPQPKEIPMHLRREQTVDEKMKAMIAAMLSREAQRNGQETFEEANDFDIEDDDIDDVLSPYEVLDMHFEQPAPEPTTPLQNGVQAEGPGPVDPAPSPEGKT